MEVFMDGTTAAAQLLRRREAAAVLGIGERTLFSLTARGAIPSRRIGRAVRYSPGELSAWVRAGCPCEPGAGVRVREAARE